MEYVSCLSSKTTFFCLELCLIFPIVFCASIENVNPADYVFISKGAGINLEWRVTYNIFETLLIFYCGYIEKQTLFPLVFDVFGDQFDTVLTRTPPKRYKLPNGNNTWIKKIDGYYDKNSKTYKFEFLRIESNITCGCELRYFKNSSQFSINNGLVAIAIVDKRFDETSKTCGIRHGVVLLIATIFSVIFLPLLFAGDWVFKKYFGKYAFVLLNIPAKSIPEKCNESINMQIILEKSYEPINTQSIPEKINETINTQSITTKINEPINSQSIPEKGNEPINTQSISEKSNKPVNTQSILQKSNKPINTQPIVEKSNELINLQPILEKSNKPINTQPILKKSSEPINTQSISEKSNQLINMQLIPDKSNKPFYDPMDGIN